VSEVADSLRAMPKTKIELVEQYQCPGCMNGPNPSECPQFSEANYGCANHHAATGMAPHGLLFLGLPKGFNRVGLNAQRSIVSDAEKMPGQLRVFENVEAAGATTIYGTAYDKFNVPVWAMDHEGDLLVRCFSPRVGVHYVDVIGGAKRADVCPDAIDVAEFIDDID
jgi:hypothetical protein